MQSHVGKSGTTKTGYEAKFVHLADRIKEIIVAFIDAGLVERFNNVEDEEARAMPIQASIHG
ncbi:predicted protein [Plenodomus lingam JN3]|uniref:Predicted protein n=1 Tax=Leptosphaeria maculans (strain JN3 / isolate v23.1.3 / race Av1-4-5-6-7-8) TaxID=985895 RepID=E4ZZM2_LEPMJ|nr:predicted protein [Plenodomus lingam JN3]CBX97138.1 predicted protein [Plenodomus lingam JN3]